MKEVIIGTDSGREGEIIARYTLMLAENNKYTTRLWTNSLTAADIIEAMKSRKTAEQYNNLFYAAQARDEIDYLIGKNFSRFYSLRDKRTHTIGRCQMAILNIMCLREKEIENFKAKGYYKLKACIKGKNRDFMATSVKDISTKYTAEILLSNIKERDGIIKKFNSEEKVIKSPKLLNLNDLQIICINKFKYTAEEVLDIAQTLYEKKYLSYPRTEARMIKSTEVKEIEERLINLSEIFKLEVKNENFNKIVNDEMIEDHTALMPKIDKVEEYSSLNEKEKNVLDQVIISYYAALQDDYRYIRNKIEIDIGGVDFEASDTETITNGFKNVYGEKEKKSELWFKEGEIVKVNNIKLESLITSPPGRYNEASLLQVLESPGKFLKDKELSKVLNDKGIGTVATRTKLITKLFDSGYVIKEKDKIIPTIDAMKLIDTILPAIKDPGYTAELEQKLQEIEKGEKHKDEVMKEVLSFLKESMEKLKGEFKEDEKSKRIYGICPICKSGKIVDAGTKGYGCTNLKINGCRFYVSKRILETYINEEQLKNILVKGRTSVLKFYGPKGAFKASIVLKEGKTKFEYSR